MGNTFYCPRCKAKLSPILYRESETKCSYCGTILPSALLQTYITHLAHYQQSKGYQISPKKLHQTLPNKGASSNAIAFLEVFAWLNLVAGVIAAFMVWGNGIHLESPFAILFGAAFSC